MEAKRLAAATNGEKHFFGSECRNCGTTKRTTINNTCIACSNNRARISMSKQREQIKRLMSEAKSEERDAMGRIRAELA